ncbi:MAG: phage/plasmid primase, P4 family [Desulfuromonadaceae bacterium]|nr:phage/plasmid primase, P4 family [Desulfuromonadaceae bacterium]
MSSDFTISKISSSSDNKPLKVKTSWPEFVESILTPVIRGKLSHSEYLNAEKGIKDKQKDGSAIIAGTYSKPETRLQTDLVELSLITLDIDESNLTFDQLCKRLQGFEAVVFTSYSHSLNHPKFRAYILLQRPITGEIKRDLGRIIDFFDDRIGNIDPVCRKPGQLFYTPACPPDGEEFFQSRHLSGTALDPADFPAPPTQAKPERATGTKPGDDYNSRASWPDLLEPLGWSRFFRNHYTRPGKQRGISGSILDAGFYCHTSAPEATPFKCDNIYSLFSAYALIHHSGDYSAAARDLASQGYGGPFQCEVEAPDDITTAIAVEAPNLLTDQRLKNYFAKSFGHLAKFVPGIGWHRFDGKRWCTDMPGGLHPLIDKMQQHLMEESAKITDEKARIDRRKALIGMESHNRQLTLIQACQCVPALIVTANQLDRDPMFLNCQNGTIDLSTGTLKLHNPDDLITRVINIQFSPSATCPTFLRFIFWAMQGDMELVSYMQRFIGYCLTGKTSEQIFNFWYGTGSNGKTTLMNVLQWLLCDYAATADTGLIMQRSNGNDGNRLSMLAGLRGSRFVTLSEINDGEKLDEAAIKSYTGGDSISCRLLYQNFFTYTPQSKLVGFGNYKPNVRGTDHGIWRRIHLIPFRAVISEDQKDPRLPEKLRSELPGILAWAVQGCLEWQRIGLMPPKVVMEAVKEYRQNEDTFQSWLNDKCILNEYERTPASELIASYRDYSGLKSITETRFGKMLSDHGFTKNRSNGIKWAGLALGSNSNTSPEKWNGGTVATCFHKVPKEIYFGKLLENAPTVPHCSISDFDPNEHNPQLYK